VLLPLLDLALVVQCVAVDDAVVPVVDRVDVRALEAALDVACRFVVVRFGVGLEGESVLGCRDDVRDRRHLLGRRLVLVLLWDVHLVVHEDEFIGHLERHPRCVRRLADLLPVLLGRFLVCAVEFARVVVPDGVEVCALDLGEGDRVRAAH